MSKSRAQKKQRQRARASGGGDGGAAGTRPSTADPRPPRTARPESDLPPPRSASRASAPASQEPARGRNPSRLEIRDGVARPDAIWAPFPLTELGMGVGLVLFVLGFASAPALLLAGVGVLVVVVAELCLREHFAGFRSHSILLGMLPVTTVHLAVVVVGDVEWRGPLALAIDLAIAGALAWWLQRRFRVARGRAQLRVT